MEPTNGAETFSLIQNDESPFAAHRVAVGQTKSRIACNEIGDRMKCRSPLPSTVVVILVLLVRVTVIEAAGAPPNGFRSFKWGASPDGGLKKIAGPTDGVTMYAPASGKTLPPLFGLPVSEEAYSFSRGKFYSGSAWFDGRENFTKVKAALFKEFGQPAFANENTSVWKWKWPNSKIEVQLSYQAKFSRTTITFVNNAI